VTQDDDRIPTPRAQRLEDFKRRTLPLAVWSLCAAAVFGMLVSRGRGGDVVGVAEPKRHEISASVASRIASVGVRLYDRVGAGSVIAVLDDTQLRAALATATATVRHLQAELEAGKVGFTLGPSDGVGALTSELRRYQLDEERQRLELLAVRVDLEGDRVELERLRLAHDRARTLHAAGLIGTAELDEARLLHQEAERGVEENERLLQESQTSLSLVEARRLAFEQTLPEFKRREPTLLAPLREAVEVEIARLQEIESQRESLILRTPVGGRVSQVLATAGQAVVAGEPIVILDEDGVQDVVAWLREGEDVPLSTPVRLVEMHSGRVAESVVTGVSPGIDALPQRLWRDARVPEYGRGVMIAASPELSLTPGALVRVRFRR
jgi:multidrug resistance efflux pump